MESPPARKRQRLNSGPLKLEAFANAKSTKYNIKELKRKHEFIQNAQKVRKFRKQLGKGELEGTDRRFDQQPQTTNLSDASQVAPRNPDNVSLRKEESAEGESHWRKRSADGGQNSGFVRKKTKRKISQVERLKREADAKRAAQEAERQERLREIERRQKEKEAAERARKQTFAKMHKKTSRGQPVMKHRMEHLLEKLQKEAG